MRILTTSAALIAVAGPALAAGKDKAFFSLANTDFVVLLGFLLFLAVLAYFKVPGLLGGMLDKRAEGIRDELNEAKALREEAQQLLASFERKQTEVQQQAGRIVEAAKKDADAAAEQAKEALAASIKRRLAAAEDQIASAEAGAVKEVRDAAITVAVAAASDVIAKKMTAKEATALVNASIDEVAAKLH
ncbi:MAG: F0F1 ATP synthase subunit B [Pseudomonadota bacterium]